MYVFAVQPVSQLVFFFHLPTNILAVCWLFLHSATLSTAPYIFEARQLGCSGNKLEFIFSFLFFVYLKKNHYHEEPAILSLNSVSFAGESCVEQGVQAIFLPWFSFILPPSHSSFPPCLLFRSLNSPMNICLLSPFQLQFLAGP